MNIAKVQGTATRRFEFEYFDNDGAEQKDTVVMQIKRVSYRKVVAKEFQELLQGIKKDDEKLAPFICDLIESWDLTADDAGAIYEITPDNLLDLDQSLFNEIAKTVAAVVFPNFQKVKP